MVSVSRSSSDFALGAPHFVLPLVKWRRIAPGESAMAVAMSGRPPLSPLAGDPLMLSVMTRAGEKWTSRIVALLGFGSMRFNEIRRALDGVTQRMLTRSLRGLERDGMVARTVADSSAAHVEYRLTPLGLSALEVLKLMQAWVVEHHDEIAQAQYDFDTVQQDGW
jgi:DNA-binding HxlR family transcriptional regulator